MTTIQAIALIFTLPLLLLVAATAVSIPLTLLDYIEELRKRIKTKRAHKNFVKTYGDYSGIARYMYDDTPWRW